MNPGMKMLLATSVGERKNDNGGRMDRQENESRMRRGREQTKGRAVGMDGPGMDGGDYQNDDRSEYRGWEDTDSRRRGRGTRSEYAEYTQDNGDEWFDPEDKYRDRNGRERYDNGRFAPMRNSYDENQDHYPAYPRMPPIYEQPKNKVGFSAEGEMERMHSTEGNESMEAMPFTRVVAEKWTRGMENEDGSTGPHWTLEQVKQVMAQKSVDCDPYVFFAILNSIYSDYGKVAKKHGVGDKLDFYVDMAKAWVEDKDAVPDKASAYFRHVVRQK